MFWEWFWELFIDTFGGRESCPKYVLWPCDDCGYYVYDSFTGEYDCEGPEEDLECDGCKYLICDRCKNAEVTKDKEL